MSFMTGGLISYFILLLFYTSYVAQIPWGNYRDRSVFHNVTDFALKQDAKDHKHPQTLSPELARQRDIEDLDVVFADLPHYGCPRQSVKGRYNDKQKDKGRGESRAPT